MICDIANDFDLSAEFFRADVGQCCARCWQKRPRGAALHRRGRRLHVLVDGRILLEDGVLLTLDEEVLLARAAQQTHSLLGRAAQR